MKKLCPEMILIGMLCLVMVSCFTIGISAKKTKSQTTKFDDVICGKNIYWHIHLQGGFKNDTVLFVVGKRDTLLAINDVSTDKNGCTRIYLSAFKQERKMNLFLKNMPSFNLVKEGVLIPKDSIIVDLIINNKTLKFRESLKRHKYFGFSYDSIYHSITYLKSKECFGCE